MGGEEMERYLIVGAGLYGAVMARELKDAGKNVLVIDKRDHIAGKVYMVTTRTYRERNS